MRRALAVLVLLLVATGCAGRDFVRTPAESLALGKTTEAEIRQRHGSPYREGTVMKNGETVIHEIGHYFGLDDDTMHRIEEDEG